MSKYHSSSIYDFFESNSYEDTIRNAIDKEYNDTIAAIAGSVSETYYGILKEINEQGLLYLDDF